MKGFTTCLWFDHQAEEAARFYTSLFKHSKVTSTSYYGPAAAEVSGKPAGSVLTVGFELMGQKFMALNGGPEFRFTEAVSLVVNCDDQEEIDEYWAKLTAGGSESQCGWLKDKYGLSWQVVPAKLNDLITDEDQAKADRVMAAMLPMKKLDWETLKRAAEEVESYR